LAKTTRHSTKVFVSGNRQASNYGCISGPVSGCVFVEGAIKISPPNLI